MTYRHRIVRQIVFETILILHFSGDIGDLAEQIDIGCLTGLYRKFGVSLEIAFVPACRHGIAGPGLGYIAARQHWESSDRHLGQSIVTAHKTAFGSRDPYHGAGLDIIFYRTRHHSHISAQRGAEHYTALARAFEFLFGAACQREHGRAGSKYADFLH